MGMYLMLTILCRLLSAMAYRIIFLRALSGKKAARLLCWLASIFVIMLLGTNRDGQSFELGVRKTSYYIRHGHHQASQKIQIYMRIYSPVTNNNKMSEPKEESQSTQATETTSVTKITIPSKKIQINNFQHELVQEFVGTMKENASSITHLSIQGNSYSLDFCKEFSNSYLAKAQNLKTLDINDIFVSRSKEEIPASIQAISKALVNTKLLHLDISHNAVNPYGAKALLNFLNVGKSLEVLLISNCGLGPLGVAEIAKGLEGTPNLRVLSIGRNRMENAGIISLAESMKFIPKLEQLFVYQNTLKKEGLSKLFAELRSHCKMLNSFDLCDNFVREEATQELFKLLVENLELKNLNLNDCLNEGQNQKVVEAFETTKNRNFIRLGFNYIELQQQLAFRLLEVLKQCPLKRLDIMGNDFPKKVKKAYTEAFPEAGVLSRFDEDEDQQQQLNRLFEQMKL